VFAIFSFPMDRWLIESGLKKTLMLGLLFYIITYSIFPFVTSTVVIFGLFFIYGLYAASSEGIAKAWISNLCAAEDKATAIRLPIPAFQHYRSRLQYTHRFYLVGFFRFFSTLGFWGWSFYYVVVLS